MAKSDKTFELTDFRMAGFLVARGRTLVETYRNGELVFVFDDEDGNASSTMLEYAGSPEGKYDAACVAMHKLTQSRRRERRRR